MICVQTLRAYFLGESMAPGLPIGFIHSYKEY